MRTALIILSAAISGAFGAIAFGEDGEVVDLCVDSSSNCDECLQGKENQKLEENTYFTIYSTFKVN